MSVEAEETVDELYSFLDESSMDQQVYSELLKKQLTFHQQQTMICVSSKAMFSHLFWNEQSLQGEMKLLNISQANKQ